MTSIQTCTINEFFDSDDESTNYQSDYFIGSIKSSEPEPEPIKPLEADVIFKTIVKRLGATYNIVNLLIAFADQFDNDHWTIIAICIEKTGKIERKLALHCQQTGDLIIVNQANFGRRRTQTETIISIYRESMVMLTLSEPPPNLFWYELTEGVGMSQPVIKRAKTQLKSRSSSGICSFVLSM